MQLFQVGGSVRDELLGLPSKDVDFVAVLTGNEDGWHTMGGHDPFNVMVHELESLGFKIFLKSPEFLTVRAQFPREKRGIAGVIQNSGLTADFVLARKESGYTDGRRPDTVEPGTLEDDLARRDFTVNAMAKDSQGNLIDPHNGRADLRVGILRAVGDPFTRLTEDALRAVRALRFSVTKDFVIDPHLRWAMQTAAVLDALEHKISDERIQQEISKMVRHDPVESIIKFNEFMPLTRVLFSGSVNLDATMKQRGFK